VALAVADSGSGVALMTPDEQALKDKLVALMTAFRDECLKPEANPYILLRRLEIEVENVRHELIVAGKK